MRAELPRSCAPRADTVAQVITRYLVLITRSVTAVCTAYGVTPRVYIVSTFFYEKLYELVPKTTRRKYSFENVARCGVAPDLRRSC